jgi:hypothetical protein
MRTLPIFRTATDADAEAVSAVYLASRKELVSFAPLAHSDQAVRQWEASGPTALMSSSMGIKAVPAYSFFEGP